MFKTFIVEIRPSWPFSSSAVCLRVREKIEVFAFSYVL
jgi:hypothetical protein